MIVRIIKDGIFATICGASTLLVTIYFFIDKEWVLPVALVISYLTVMATLIMLPLHRLEELK